MTFEFMVNDSEELGGDEGHCGHIRLRLQCKSLNETYIELMGSKSDPTQFYIWQQFSNDMITITPIKLNTTWLSTTPIGQVSPVITTK